MQESLTDSESSSAQRLGVELLLSQQTQRCKCAGKAVLAKLWTDINGSLLLGLASEQAHPAAIGISVRLHRQTGRLRFGFDCSELAGTIIVSAIDAESALQDWNECCANVEEPWRRVHLGAVIVAVNNVFGDVRRMQSELEVSSSVELLICNPPTIDAMVMMIRILQSGETIHSAQQFWAEVSKALSVQTMADPSGREISNLKQLCNKDVTVLITTSPVPSNPSTEMLERILKSFSLVPGLAKARRILVCDGCRVVKAGQKTNHKAGKVNLDDADRYSEFIANVRQRTLDFDEETWNPFAELEILVLDERLGFGYAVRRALVEVTTRYVLVVQHDQEFIVGFDLEAVIQCMDLNAEIVKYIGFCSVSTLNYDHMARSKFGVQVFSTNEFGIPLMPLIFFYDKPHICSTTFYREFVFGPGSLVGPGDFIEETLGTSQRADIIHNGMAAHQKYGTFQLDTRDTAGEPFALVRHVNGRSFMSPEQRRAFGWPAAVRFCV